MAKRRNDVTQQLEELKERATRAGVEQRKAEADVHAIEAVLDELRERQVDAYAASDKDRGDALTAEIDEAAMRLKQAGALAEGLARRAQAAQAELANLRTDHARELLEAREPGARDITSKLNAAVPEVIRLHDEYLAERAEQDRGVSATPGAMPRLDGPPTEHAWERALRDLKRAYREHPEIEPPLPRWHGLAHRQQEDAVARREQLRRKRRRTREEQAEVEHINRWLRIAQ